MTVPATVQTRNREVTEFSQKTFGYLAEFGTLEELIAATRAMRDAGLTRFDAFSPWPDDELSEAINPKATWVPFVMLMGGLTGGGLIYALEAWVNLEAYPLNIGGRPLHSWPAFLIPTFECTVLLSAISGLIGMLALNRLPRLNHPLFAVPAFVERGRSSFFLCVEAADPKFDAAESYRFLQNLRPREIWHVPAE